MISLRARALAAATGISALALGACGLAIFLAVRATLVADFDADLAARLRACVALVEIGHRGIAVHLPGGEEYAAGGDAFVFIRTGSGATLARSPSLGDRDLPSGGGTPDEPAFSSLAIGETAVRAASAGWSAHHGGSSPREVRLEATIARGTAGLDATLERIAWLLAGVTAVAALSCGLAMGAAMRRALAPLDDLGRRIGGLDDRTLGSRLGDANVPRELAPMVERLDALLARLEQAFAREKRFGAAVAHELRTPISGLRAAIELCLARPRDTDEYRRALGDCADIAGQMQGLVESLLLLARLDAGQVAARTAEVEVGEALRSWWRAYADAASARGLRIGWDCAPTVARTDADLLRLVVANLYDNAVSHADAEGDVRIACALADGRARIEIANGGCQLPADQIERAFDRFWRGDAGRGATGRHCGLGLALCRDLARVLGGTITARVEGGRFVATVELPTAA